MIKGPEGFGAFDEPQPDLAEAPQQALPELPEGSAPIAPADTPVAPPLRINESGGGIHDGLGTNRPPRPIPPGFKPKESYFPGPPKRDNV